GTDCTVRAVSPINCTKVSMELLVAASALATDSVDGHRSRPSGGMRLDLLKVVGSSPERLASPEGDSPARSASRSSAVQIWSWVSIFEAFGCLAIGRSRSKLGIITSINRKSRSGARASMQPLKCAGAADTVGSGPELPGKSQASQRQGRTSELVRPNLKLLQIPRRTHSGTSN